jgi:2-polyprenyl-6-hydroxyphenyl methylase/3-demethylubiquinone-9 3-methyltransferase
MAIDQRWWDDLGERWWDPHGPVASLHELNEARTAYAIGVIRGAVPELAHPRVLDVGAGGGLLSGSLSAAGFDVVGVDASAPSLEVAREHTTPRGGGWAPEFVCGNAMLLPFADESFDAAVCSSVLEHVASPAVLIDEVARVLRPGGVLCFDTPNRTWYAWLTLISIGENIGWTARGCHRYQDFLTPSEVTDYLRSAGLRMRDLRGLSLRRGPAKALGNYLLRRDAGGFRLSSDLRLMIAGAAAKPVRPELEAVTDLERGEGARSPMAVEGGAR